MAHGREYESWEHTALLCTVFVNLWSKKQMHVADFHPFMLKERYKTQTVSLREFSMKYCRPPSTKVQRGNVGK